MIKAATIWDKSKIPLSFDQRKVIFKEYSESDVKRGTSQMCAPLLCIFSGCDLMVMENEDVLQGIVNGTVTTQPRPSPSYKVDMFFLMHTTSKGDAELTLCCRAKCHCGLFGAVGPGGGRPLAE